MNDCGNRRYSLASARRHSERYKSLDAGDEIYIPNFYSRAQPSSYHSDAGMQNGADSSSQVSTHHIRPQTPVYNATQTYTTPLRPGLCSSPPSRPIADIAFPLTPTTTSRSTRHDHHSPFSNQRSTHLSKGPRSQQTPSSHVLNSPLTPATSPATPNSMTNRAALINYEITSYISQTQPSGCRASSRAAASSRTFIPSRAVAAAQVRGHHSPPPSPSPAPSSSPSHSLGIFTFFPTTNTALTTSTMPKDHYGNPLLPSSSNCAVYLTHIPACTTYTDLLSSIRGGAIYICHLDPPTSQHATCAAKIVFFTRVSAEAFMARASGESGATSCAGGIGGEDESGAGSASDTSGGGSGGGGGETGRGGIYILGHRVKAVWNRIRYGEYARHWQSRVLIVRGPRRWMDRGFWEGWFAARFVFELEGWEERRYREGKGGKSVLEDGESRGENNRQRNRDGWCEHVWRFACVRAQAELAFIAVQRELGDAFEVVYGVDPCAGPWEGE